MIWMQFALCAMVILIAGSRLSHYAESLAERTNFSKGWVGLVLVAMTTSLSQLVASLSAVLLYSLPDMAVSGLIGSCMVNSLLIGLLDLISKDKPVSYKVHEGHLLSAGFGIILMGIVAIDILFGKRLPILHFVHNMDPITIIIFPLYLMAMRLIFRFESTRVREYAQEESRQDKTGASLAMLVGFFTASAAAIIAASYYLPELAKEIAAKTGWGQSFMGSSLIAITTCLPEAAVSISAARRGSFDMAVASLLGSNLCYIVILAISDFCYLKEPLLRSVSNSDTLVAISAIISMGIVVVGLTYKPGKKLLFISGDAVALILMYLFTNILLFAAP